MAKHCFYSLTAVISLELSKVGLDRRWAYDLGLVRDLSKDNDHKLVCKQSIMMGYGK